MITSVQIRSRKYNLYTIFIKKNFEKMLEDGLSTRIYII